MIKKLLLASFFATILSITNYVSAHNFVPISTSGYDYLYLDTDTVNVVLYNPPSYIIDAEYSEETLVSTQIQLPKYASIMTLQRRRFNIKR